MLSASVIQDLSRDYAIRACVAERVPLPVFPEDLSHLPPFPFPALGDYRPGGYRLIDTLFVDSSGFGADDEWALSIPRFIAWLRLHINSPYYYAVIESGEFQVYVGVFVRDPSEPGNQAEFDVAEETGTLSDLCGYGDDDES